MRFRKLRLAIGELCADCCKLPSQPAKFRAVAAVPRGAGFRTGFGQRRFRRLETDRGFLEDATGVPFPLRLGLGESRRLRAFPLLFGFRECNVEFPLRAIVYPVGFRPRVRKFEFALFNSTFQRANFVSEPACFACIAPFLPELRLGARIFQRKLGFSKLRRQIGDGAIRLQPPFFFPLRFARTQA